MTEEIIFRNARADDIEILADLISIIFALEEDFTVDKQKQIRALQMLLQNPDNACIFVADCSGQAIAMCSAQLLLSTAEGGYKALVEDVVVSPEFQGRNIGKRLLEQVELWARQKNIKRLDLAPDLDNEKGLAFYKKLGWSETNMTMMQKKLY